MLTGEDTEEERIIARLKTMAKEPRILMLMEPVVIK